MGFPMDFMAKTMHEIFQMVGRYNVSPSPFTSINLQVEGAKAPLLLLLYIALTKSGNICSKCPALLLYLIEASSKGVAKTTTSTHEVSLDAYECFYANPY